MSFILQDLLDLTKFHPSISAKSGYVQTINQFLRLEVLNDLAMTTPIGNNGLVFNYHRRKAPKLSY